MQWALGGGVGDDSGGKQRQRWARGRRAGTAAAPSGADPGAEEALPAVNPVVVAEVEAILAQVQEELTAGRAGRAPVNGKPGPRHPWRRQPLSTPRPPHSAPPNAAKL